MAAPPAAPAPEHPARLREQEPGPRPGSGRRRARYRDTRQTKGFNCYSAPPHLSRSPNSGAFSFLAAFPCFWSSSYGRSRWLLIG
ncbi:15-hydroxyprostaglandin dehydrogenase [Platysternon megacephalum]|uniref:15-hydroxyprostaglandin dehydrogenase n=1 Tax=Platysternon megacephalum TaxID=55544 RepID=A0A4D9DXR1_9SAUR|nr:15-hydroxyprostaglandin dehydrogenase [Platysternon megacephalum]